MINKPAVIRKEGLQHFYILPPLRISVNANWPLSAALAVSLVRGLRGSYTTSCRQLGGREEMTLIAEAHDVAHRPPHSRTSLTFPI